MSTFTLREVLGAAKDRGYGDTSLDLAPLAATMMQGGAGESSPQEHKLPLKTGRAPSATGSCDW